MCKTRLCLPVHVLMVIVLPVTVLARDSLGSFRVGTFNLWNVMFNWEERLQYIATVIKEQDIDIVAFQEVRFSTDQATGLKISQLEVARKYLPHHKWLMAQPAGPAGHPQDAYWKGWTEEGLGILSKFPIEQSTKVNLTRSGGKDPNPRLALHVQIRVSQAPHRVVNVVAVHFSYEKRQQCRNAQHVLNFLATKNMKNVIVLGDFNAYQDFSEPVDIFTSKDTTLCSFLRPGAPLFKDAVVASLKSDQRAPFTFSNMPSPGLVSRPDRILVSSSIQVKDSILYGQGEPFSSRFYTAIVMNRVKSVLKSAFDSFVGKIGYSCLHDCGPHGSCRCGICVRGGNKLNCHIPDCSECSSESFILFFTIITPIVSTALLMTFYIVRALVISAKFNQEDLFNILSYRCCLFNIGLFRSRTIPRRFKSYLGRVSVLCRLPPIPMIVLTLTVLAFLSLVLYRNFYRNLEFVYSILPEELFPSDHLMIAAEIRIHMS